MKTTKQWEEETREIMYKELSTYIDPFIISSILNSAFQSFSVRLAEIEKEAVQMKKEIGYGEGQEKPTMADEATALAYESNADAFFAGYDKAISMVADLFAQLKK